MLSRGGVPLGVLFRALEWCKSRLNLSSVAKFPLRSPSERVGGLFYFGRMLDKIRQHAKRELPSDIMLIWEKVLMKNA